VARALATDPYQTFKFSVSIPNPDGSGEMISAGFMTCALPELTVEAAEYKTGLMKIKQKYPGNPGVNDCTLTRGLMKKDSALFDLVQKSILGQAYRTDVTITLTHRDGTKMPYILHEAFGLRAKMGADLDANGNDVSVEEMDIQYEDFSFSNDGGATFIRATG
jgi:phage tail-like protein